MGARQKCLWMITAIVALPATAAPAAAPPDICDTIARIAAAADERPAFGSLRRALAEGQTLVPGFETGECAVTVEGVECRGRRFVSAFHDWPDLATCRGVTEVELPLPRQQRRWPSNQTYRLGQFMIARGVHCPGCAALGPSYFTMTFYRPGRRQ